jgi:hypothetical protein
VALEARLTGWTGPAVVSVFGYLNGAAMSQAKLGALGIAGIVSTLFVTVALGAALVVAIRAPWGRIAVRVAGSWIVAIGLLLLGWSLRAQHQLHRDALAARGVAARICVFPDRHATNALLPLS